MVNMADQYLQGAGREVDVQKAVTFGLCFHMCFFSRVGETFFLTYKVDCQKELNVECTCTTLVKVTSHY